MSVKIWLEISFVLQAVFSVLVLTTMIRRKVVSVFPFLAALLAVLAVWQPVQILTLYHRRVFALSRDQAWHVFLVGSLIFDAFFILLQVLTIYSVFGEAMRPMRGLHRAGKIVFRWVGVVSALVALSLISGPELFAGSNAILMVISHLHQGIGVLTICLLVFVCFATRPLGLTFRSHIFGVSLGLGLVSTVNLVQAAWLVTKGAGTPYSGIYLFDSVGFCCSLAVWGIYFALPEPKRQMILLPTTSPFFLWNRISEVLGDAPGQVAVAGFSPEMLADAEIEMLTAATASETFEEDNAEPWRMSKELPPAPEFVPGRRPSLAL